MTRAPGFSEKTGTHDPCTDGEDAEGDDEATCVVAIAVGSSATAVVVAWSAAGRSPALHLRLALFGRARDGPRGGVIGIAASVMGWFGSRVPSMPPWACARGRSRGTGGRVPVHA